MLHCIYIALFRMDSKDFVNQFRKPLRDLPSPNPAVRRFHRSLPQYAPTPLVSLPEIAEELGVRYVLLKDETSRLDLPAFKILGASWATVQALRERFGLLQDNPSAEVNLQELSAKAQAADITLYAATEGNHGRAVSRMAKYLGIKSRIFVPAMSDDDVKAKIESEGAEVVVWKGSYDQAVLATKSAADNQVDGNGVLISDTALVPGEKTAQWIVDGYQTMFDEIEEQVKAVTSERITHVLSPVGVGSLCQAVVTHFGTISQSPEIITVEPTEAACLKASLEAGELTSIEVGHTICSGMCCGTPSANAWATLRDGVSRAVSVEDVDVEMSLLELHRLGVNAGPCGAATTAAVKRLPGLEHDAVVILLCTEGARRYEMVSKK